MKKRRFGICLALAAAAGTLSLAGCGGDTAMADVLSAGMEQETCDINGDYSKIDIQAELAYGFHGGLSGAGIYDGADGEG